MGDGRDTANSEKKSPEELSQRHLSEIESERHAGKSHSRLHEQACKELSRDNSVSFKKLRADSGKDNGNEAGDSEDAVNAGSSSRGSKRKDNKAGSGKCKSESAEPENSESQSPLTARPVKIVAVNDGQYALPGSLKSCPDSSKFTLPAEPQLKDKTDKPAANQSPAAVDEVGTALPLMALPQQELEKHLSVSAAQANAPETQPARIDNTSPDATLAAQQKFLPSTSLPLMAMPQQDLQKYVLSPDNPAKSPPAAPADNSNNSTYIALLSRQQFLPATAVPLMAMPQQDLQKYVLTPDKQDKTPAAAPADNSYNGTYVTSLAQQKFLPATALPVMSMPQQDLQKYVLSPDKQDKTQAESTTNNVIFNPISVASQRLPLSDVTALTAREPKSDAQVLSSRSIAAQQSFTADTASGAVRETTRSKYNNENSPETVTIRPAEREDSASSSRNVSRFRDDAQDAPSRNRAATGSASENTASAGNQSSGSDRSGDRQNSQAKLNNDANSLAQPAARVEQKGGALSDQSGQSWSKASGDTLKAGQDMSKPSQDTQKLAADTQKLALEAQKSVTESIASKKLKEAELEFVRYLAAPGSVSGQAGGQKHSDQSPAGSLSNILARMAQPGSLAIALEGLSSKTASPAAGNRDSKAPPAGRTDVVSGPVSLAQIPGRAQTPGDGILGAQPAASTRVGGAMENVQGNVALGARGPVAVDVGSANALLAGKGIFAVVDAQLAVRGLVSDTVIGGRVGPVAVSSGLPAALGPAQPGISRAGNVGSTFVDSSGRAVRVDPLTGRIIVVAVEGDLTAKSLNLSEMRRIQKTLSERRYLTGVEIAIACALASAAVARSRNGQTGEQEKEGEAAAADLKQLFADVYPGLNNDGSGSAPNQNLYKRPTYVIAHNDSLVEIAERMFNDANVAWLIADINGGRITEHAEDGKRIVELRSRQEIELPLPSEIKEFVLTKGKELNAQDLVTIVSVTEIDRELLNSFLSTVVGAEKQAESGQHVELPAATTAAPAVPPLMQLVDYGLKLGKSLMPSMNAIVNKGLNLRTFIARVDVVSSAPVAQRLNPEVQA